MAVNNMYQPWRAILSMINQCLTGKTFGFDTPRYPVLHMLWGIITSTNVDYAELIWEEFVQAMQTFLVDKANLSIAPRKGKKTKLHPLHLAEKDHRLGNLKFVPKGEEDEVFGMQIPKEMITNNIRNAPYYNAYMEMVAKHDKKITAEKGGKKKSASKADQSKQPITAKQTKPVPSKQSKLTPATKPKVTLKNPSKPSPAKHPKRGKVQKVRKGKSPLKLIDEDEEVHHEPEPQGVGEDYDLNRAIQMSLETFRTHGKALVGGVAIRKQVEEATQQLPVIEGKGKAITTDEQAAQSLLALHTLKRRSTTDQFIFQRRTPATEDASTGPSTQPRDDASANIVRGSLSLADAKTGADTDITTSIANTEVLYAEDVQDPGKTPESQPPPEHEHMDEDQAGPNPGQSHEALAGPNPEPIHDDFIAIVYPKVHESLKHTIEEHVHLDNPLSSSRTLSSMKNSIDAFTFDDQFLDDKHVEEEPGKTTVKTKVEFMVTVPIHQASTSVLPLSTPIINLSPPKLVSSPLQEPVIAATTEATTTTLPLPPPPQQQSTTDYSLASRVMTLEQRCADLEKKHKLQDQTNQALSSRIFTLELRDLPHKINQTVNEVIKEVMFENGSYKSLPEHVALYEALEASMKCANMDKFLAEKDKSRKRRRDDQDPPPPPDSYLSKKKRHDSDASCLKQPPAPQSSAWKTSDTREAPSSSSKQKSIPHSEQPVEDMPIPDDVNILDSEDTDTAHLPKINTRPDWLKPVPEEDRLETPEPDWIIPPNDLPEAKNN
ncbi:hypothetical protein Tco_0490015 [Tanacetum coccineum]